MKLACRHSARHSTVTHVPDISCVHSVINGIWRTRPHKASWESHGDFVHTDTVRGPKGTICLAASQSRPLRSTSLQPKARDNEEVRAPRHKVHRGRGKKPRGHRHRRPTVTHHQSTSHRRTKRRLQRRSYRRWRALLRPVAGNHSCHRAVPPARGGRNAQGGRTAPTAPPGETTRCTLGRGPHPHRNHRGQQDGDGNTPTERPDDDHTHTHPTHTTFQPTAHEPPTPHTPDHNSRG